MIYTAFVLSACRPTYEFSNVESEIKNICENEYKTQVEVVASGSTVYAVVDLHTFLLDFKLLADEDYQKMGDVLMSVSRVVLSSDGNFKFIVLIARGAGFGSIKLTRYVSDIKRFQLEDISRNEFFERMLIDTEPGDLNDLLHKNQTTAFEAYPDINFEDFLAKQSAQRIKGFLTGNSELNSLLNITDAAGYYSQMLFDFEEGFKLEFLNYDSERNMIYRALARFMPFFNKIQAKGKDFVSYSGEASFKFDIKAEFTSPPLAGENEAAARRLCVYLDKKIKNIFKRYGFKDYAEINYCLTAQKLRFISVN